MVILFLNVHAGTCLQQEGRPRGALVYIHAMLWIRGSMRNIEWAKKLILAAQHLDSAQSWCVNY